MNSKKEVQHVYLVGAKSLGAYGGYETFVYKLTEYHQNQENKSDALARRTLQNAKKEAWNRWIFKKHMDDPARFVSDFRVRSPARSGKGFWT